MGVIRNTILINKDIHHIELFLEILKNPRLTLKSFQDFFIIKTNELFSGSAELSRKPLRKSEILEEVTSLYKSQQIKLQEKENSLSEAKKEFEKLPTREQDTEFLNIKEILYGFIEIKLQQSYTVETTDTMLNNNYDSITKNISELESKQNKIFDFVEAAIDILYSLEEFILSANAIKSHKQMQYSHFNNNNNTNIEDTITSTTTTTTTTTSHTTTVDTFTQRYSTDKIEKASDKPERNDPLYKNSVFKHKTYGAISDSDIVVNGVNINHDFFPSSSSPLNSSEKSQIGATVNKKNPNPKQISFENESIDERQFIQKNQEDDAELQKALQMSMGL